MNRIPKRIWCSCQKNVFFSHLGHRPPVVCRFCWECASHTNDVICPNVTQVRAERPAELFFPFFSVDQATASTKLWWPTTVTAKPKTSRQKQKHHGKTKNLTAKPKISRQNQILHSKNKIALVLPWVFAFPISGNAFDGKRRKKRGWPNTCSIGWQLCRFCHGHFPGPAHADVLTRRTGKRDEAHVHVCMRG